MGSEREVKIVDVDMKKIVIKSRAYGYTVDSEQLCVTREATWVRIGKHELDQGMVISYAMAEELGKFLASGGMAVIQDTIREENA